MSKPKIPKIENPIYDKDIQKASRHYHTSSNSNSNMGSGFMKNINVSTAKFDDDIFDIDLESTKE